MTSNSVAAIFAEGIADLIRPQLPAGSAIRQRIETDADGDPDRQVIINAYRFSSDPVVRLEHWMLQIRYRGTADDPLDVDELADPVTTFLHGLTGIVIGPITVDQILFRYSALTGRDSDNRDTRADMFDVDLCPPPDFRLD